MPAYNPFKGERLGPAWQAALDALHARMWIPHAELVEVMFEASDVKEATITSLLIDARDYGVLIRVGKYSQKLKRDYRVYRLTPPDLLVDHPNSTAWYGESGASARSGSGGSMAEPTPTPKGGIMIRKRGSLLQRDSEGEAVCSINNSGCIEPDRVMMVRRHLDGQVYPMCRVHHAMAIEQGVASNV